MPITTSESSHTLIYRPISDILYFDQMCFGFETLLSALAMHDGLCRPNSSETLYAHSMLLSVMTTDIEACPVLNAQSRDVSSVDS